MKAHELRIGNYISLKLAKSNVYDCIVVGIEQDRIYYLPWLKLKPKVDYLYSLYCYVEPIPLTEEWLEKFGFERDEEKRHGECYWVHGGFTNPQAPLFYYVDMFLSAHLGFPGWKNIKIKYVHHLQNLYFALTGEELQIDKNYKNEKQSIVS